MAEYTIELKDVVRNHNIFDFNYPFYDEEKRHKFEESFIRHFYFREIGTPVIDRFIHYLNDKMNTVFPYYNELFKAAAIEYEILDNYKLTETYERNVKNDHKQSGIVSSVGKQITDETRTGEAAAESNATGKQENEGIATENKQHTGKETATGTNKKNNDEIKKFHDTPAGMLSLDDSRYLTTLNHDTVNNTESNNNETVTDLKDENTNKTVNSSESESTEKSHSNTTDKLQAENRMVQDSNTRNYTQGEQVESYTLTRKGNIGVDTDSDAITKHIKLQKVLKNIEIMFFEECEDLFMMVY